MQTSILALKHPDDWAVWLEENQSLSTGIWLQLAKKGSVGITYAQALDIALCFGWIDGQKKGQDETTWLQYFAPRKRGSIWSQINQGHVKRLTEAGLMRPAGLAAVEAARASGEWDRAYQGQSNREVPPELQAALDRSPKAKEFFETLSSQNRFAFVFRVSTAKKPETRLKRAAQFVEMLEEHRVFYPKEKTNDRGKD